MKWLARTVTGISMLIKMALVCLVFIMLGPALAAGVAVTTLLKAPLPVGELPDEQIAVAARPSHVFDANGEQIGLYGGFDISIDISPQDVPQVLKDAVVAIEDQRFYSHDGVDFEGIARAARTNVEAGGIAQGGSTITQQYVKNVYLTNERSVERKVQEALLATEIENRMSKEEILFGYLSSVYFGAGAYGVGAAADVYFDKPVSELDVSEAATLAGLLKAPSRYSPYENLEASESRRRLVVQAMFDLGYIDQTQYEVEAARQLWPRSSETRPQGSVTELVQKRKNGAIDFPFFVDYVEQQALELLGPDAVYAGGLRIETTIQPSLQKVAEEAVAKRLGNSEYPVEMAMSSIDPETGHVVAMVGGRDYSFSQVNLATGGSTGFQPGSSFKPIVLATAFNMGLSPETRYPAPGSWKVPGCSGDCTISNYSNSGYGNITLREATRASVNTVYAQLVLDVSVRDTVTMARKLGLERIDPDQYYGASFALGSSESSTLEMASAYGTFANGGVRVPPTGILRIIDADGNVIVDNSARAGEKVFSAAVADNMSDVLRDVITSGTGKRANIGRPAAGKTGTAQAYRAAWFVGYTPDYATAVWMGHADRLAPLRSINGVGNVTGGSHPAIAWADFMSVAHEGLEVSDFPEPSEIIPIALTAEQVARFRVKEKTTAASQVQTNELLPNCGGEECQFRAQELPPVGVPDQPLYYIENVDKVSTSTTASTLNTLGTQAGQSTTVRPTVSTTVRPSIPSTTNSLPGTPTTQQSEVTTNNGSNSKISARS